MSVDVGERSGLGVCMRTGAANCGRERAAPGWGTSTHGPRACPMSEQRPLPPLQEPPPTLPPRRPVPVAVLSPAATFTTTAPFLPTLPEIVTWAWPALTRLPLVMRIG